jgi:hypothetical protein
MDPAIPVVIVAALIGVFGYAGYYVAAQKNRPGAEGAILAIAFGPFGLIVEACLPTQERVSPVLRSIPQKLPKRPWAPELIDDDEIQEHLNKMNENLSRPRRS